MYNKISAINLIQYFVNIFTRHDAFAIALIVLCKTFAAICKEKACRLPSVAVRIERPPPPYVRRLGVCVLGLAAPNQAIHEAVQILVLEV